MTAIGEAALVLCSHKREHRARASWRDSTVALDTPAPEQYRPDSKVDPIMSRPAEAGSDDSQSVTLTADSFTGPSGRLVAL